MGPALAVVGIAIFAAGTAASISESRKARKQQRKAAEVAGRRREIESRRATLAGVEDARQAIGTVTNVGAQTGGAGGSGTQGAVSSLQSQLGANATFNQQLLEFAKRQEFFLGKALDAQSRAQTFSSIAAIGAKIASFGASGAISGGGSGGGSGGSPSLGGSTSGGFTGGSGAFGSGR
jgi:hypothetical protein